MNHNPWYVAQAASYERQRIRDDMKQIRLAQKALKAETRKASPSQPQPIALKTLKHATVAVAETILGMFA